MVSEKREQRLRTDLSERGERFCRFRVFAPLNKLHHLSCVSTSTALSSPDRPADASAATSKRSPEGLDERKEPASKRSRGALKVDDAEEESTAAAGDAAAASAGADADPSHDEDEGKKPAADAAQDKKKRGGPAAAVAAAGVDSDIDELVDFERMQFTFPERLMDLLQSGSVETAMRWLPRGEAFAVVPKVFYDVVLLCHFQGTKFESFTRKLNRWYVNEKHC
jgi:HSF-type DNA-binding